MVDIANKRRPPAAGCGRKKGAKNKFSRAFKEAVLLAYDNIGGDEQFAEWAKEHQTEFYKIAARMIPQERAVTGDIEHKYVVFSPEPLSDPEEWLKKFSPQATLQ